MSQSATFPEIELFTRLRRLEPPRGRVPIVIDTDPYNEIDDQFAITYALLSPERLDVRAIYAAPFDNERSGSPARGMALSAEVARAILARLAPHGLALPEVYTGADRWMTDAGGPVASPAAEHLIALAEAQPEGEPLYVVALAAIPNIASAIRLRPAIIDKIVIVWLAGHPHSHGDTTEFNLRQDPAASRTVLDCGVPLVLVPCANVAEHLRLSGEDVANRVRGRGAIGDYLADEFENYARHVGALSRPIWDIAPLAWLIEPAWVATALVPTPVLAQSDEPRPRFGWIRDPRRHLMREAYGVQRDAVFGDFFARLDTVTHTAAGAHG
jgi:inosine-uridine nucleoside N-ribohydrolase